nr:reverse transcriptase domain-containing protein [Tanacetum cinerariifolium]
MLISYAASATITAAAPQLTIVVALTLTTAPSAARRRKGVVIRDLEETATPSTIIHTEAKSKDKGKGILVEEPKSLKKQAQIKQDEAYTRELEVELNNNIDWDEVIDHVQRKEKEDNVVKRNLEVLWELVKERFASYNPNNFSDDFLLTTLTYMFEKPDVQAQVWKNQRTVYGLAKVKSWKLLESYDLASRKKISTHKVHSGSNAQQFLRNIQSQGQSTQTQCQNIQTQYQTVQNQLANLTDMMSKFTSSNMASSLRSGTLPGNTVTNPKEDLKGITTRSGVAYKGPTIPTPSKVVKQGTKVTKDPVQTTSPQSTTHVQPPVTQSETLVSEPINALVSASMPNLKPSIPYPSRHDDERRREQANEQIEKFYEIFKDMSFEISFTDALILMPKFASTLKALIGNKEKLSEMARTPMNVHCSAVILNKLPKKFGDPGKFLIPCEFPGMDECLALADLDIDLQESKEQQETNFGLKNDIIQQVQNSCQFHGLPGDDANKQLDKFLHVTKSIKMNKVTDDTLHGQNVSREIFSTINGHKAKNEITNFRQRPDESLFEEWEHYKLSIDRSQWSELSISINSSFDTKITELKTKMAEIKKNLMRVLPVNQQVKVVTLNCETCVGPHSLSDSPATVGNTQNVYAPGAYQAYQASVHQPQVFNTNEFINFMKANDAILKNMQTNMTSLTNLNLELKNMFGQFMKMNTTSSSGLGTLPGSTITNPKDDLKGITTRRGTTYPGPTIPPTFSSLVVEHETEATKDTIHTTNNKSTEDVQPLAVPTGSLILNSELVISPIIEPVASPVSALRPNQRPSILYPSRLQDQKLRDKVNDQREKLFQIFKDLNFNISFFDALILMPKFGPSIKSLLPNKDKLYKLARTPLNEHCLVVLLKKLPEILGDPELADRLISRLVRVAEDVFVKVGTFYFPANFVVVDFDVDPRAPLILGSSFLKTGRALIDVFEEAFLNDDPSLPPPNQGNYLPEVRKELKIYEAKSDKSSIDEPLEVELKDLPPHLEYVFLEGDDKFPVIIAKDLSGEEKTALIMVLKSHKRAIACNLSDIKGIDPDFFTHKILMEEDFEPAVQHQRRVNPKIYDVIKQEENELIPTHLVTRWRVCIDYRKLNEATSKDHFPLPFMDQMLERSAGNQYYCFLEGFFGCLSHLEKMLKRCEDTDLCLNWEKSHFVVKEGIVLGHKISKEGLEVDIAKVDVITKLHHPTTIK